MLQLPLSPDPVTGALWEACMRIVAANAEARAVECALSEDRPRWLDFARIRARSPIARNHELHTLLEPAADTFAADQRQQILTVWEQVCETWATATASEWRRPGYGRPAPGTRQGCGEHPGGT
ncbi:hypothetical protein P3T27_006304 [Kitasatospora sp. MAA19]|nr:hypothetical protein [Kitasatospora sp. MAA19]